MVRFKNLSFQILVAFALLVAAAPVAAQGPVKVAVIDVERILLESNRGKAALEEIEALRKQKQAEAEGMQTRAADLRRQVEEGRLSLSQERLAQLEKQLEDSVIALRRFNDDATRELTKKRNEVLDQIEQSVFPVINEIGKEGGYTLIFNKYNSGLVYANESVDITAQVIQRYNSSGAGSRTGGGGGGR